jgi:peptidyl-dipeptidase A
MTRVDSSEIVSFLENENRQLQGLYKEWTNASWMVNTTGTKEWQAKEAAAEERYRSYLSDPERFRQIKSHLEKTQAGTVEERQLRRLYQSALENQIPADTIAEMVHLSTSLSNVFNTFRAQVDGKKMTENEIREILRTNRDQELRRKAWEASKEVGREVADGLLRLVKIRNEAARRLGYEDYHHLSFELSELDRDEIYAMFKRLKKMTDEPFRRVKAEIDEELAKRFKSDQEKLRPWHYSDPFFQEAPAIPEADITTFLREKSVEKVTADTFDAMGLEIRDLLSKSDLYEREGKNQHAFCLDMDREGDVRVLCNIKSNQYWMETMLHEFGHAVYDKYVDHRLPFILRAPAHIFTTEAVAMWFGRMVREREWMEKFLGLTKKQLNEITPKVKKMLQRQMLITARWVMTFVFFERELYARPDQDLNRLWWKLVREIQFVHPPDETDRPHWAAKIHFTIAPVYYQNYLLGELMASQLDRHIRRHVSPELFTEKTGRYLLEHIFFPGDRWGWRGLLQRATGESLNPSHFVEQFVY